MKKLLVVFLEMILFINSSALEIDEVIVDIKGAVNIPGVYTIKYGSRVSELIDIAGGLRNDADTSMINLGKVLKDEDVVIIYTVDEILEMRKSDTKVKIVDKECMCPKIDNVACIKNNIGLININTASLEELQKLAGIGKSKAEAIIEYRKKNKFKSIEELMNVDGIGENLFASIKENITV